MSDAHSHADRIARVARKVTERGLRLGRCLDETELRAFEARHGVSLPADYRAFLSRVGNGGPGPPAYGCAALGETADDMDAEQRAGWSGLPQVALPFPFTKSWVWEEGAVSDEGTREQTLRGCVYVGNDGCGMYWFVVVTGPERGNVWMICGEGITPTSPKRDFARWYEDWLDGVRDWWT
jgi:hypothetical protein